MSTSTRMRMLGPGKLERIEVSRDRFMWRFTYTNAQRRRERHNLSSDRRAAEMMSRELVRKRDMALAGLGMIDGQNERLLDILEKYVADLRGRASALYVDLLEVRVKKLIAELKAERVRDVRPHAVLEWRTKLREAGLSASTANKHVNSLRAMLTWAVTMELIAENPLRNIKQIPLNEKNKSFRRRAMSEAEIARFLDAARADDVEQAERVAALKTIHSHTQSRCYALQVRPVRVPQYAVWMAFLETGARHGELVATRWGDVDFQARTIRLRAETTKSAKERRIPLRDELLAELRALRPFHERVHRRSLNTDDRLFLTPEGKKRLACSNNLLRQLDRLLERAGIDRVDSLGDRIDLHALRHTFATRMARNGVSQVQAAKILGHSDVRLTTSVYQHLEAEDLRGAIDTLAPKPQPTPTAAAQASRFA